MGEVVVFTRDGKAFTDSREVARAFGKQHFNVLRDIRELQCSAKFRKLNFEAFKIKDLTGESTAYTSMTRDGFMFLAMGYDGERAAVIKEAYIAEFNRMEAALTTRRKSIREEGKKVRNSLTATLRGHGVAKPDEYQRVTNSTYRGLWGKTAAGLRKEHQLPERANVREHMSEVGLGMVLLSEALTSERITVTDRHGVDQCADAAIKCAEVIRGAVIEERRSRKVIGSPS